MTLMAGGCSRSNVRESKHPSACWITADLQKKKSSHNSGINFPKKKTDWAGLARTFRFPRRSWEALETCNLRVNPLPRPQNGQMDGQTDGWMDIHGSNLLSANAHVLSPFTTKSWRADGTANDLKPHSNSIQFIRFLCPTRGNKTPQKNTNNHS